MGEKRAERKMSDTAMNNYLMKDMMESDLGIVRMSAADFPTLAHEDGDFRNARGRRVAYHVYSVPGRTHGGTVLFLPGVGPGHIDYLSEIDALCRHGMRVLTVDYSGTRCADGEGLDGVYGPAADVLELIARLPEEEPLRLVGHSLGGFTGLCVLAHTPRIRRAVLLAPFVSYAWYLSRFDGQDTAAFEAYERAVYPELSGTDTVGYLAATDADILLIQSTDDHMIPFDCAVGRVMREIENPHLTFEVKEGRKHNPNYCDAVLADAGRMFALAGAKIAAGELNTPEKRRAFFAGYTMKDLTRQDEEMADRIAAFLNA